MPFPRAIIVILEIIFLQSISTLTGEKRDYRQTFFNSAWDRCSYQILSGMFTRSGFYKFFGRNHLYFLYLSESCPVVKAGFFIPHQGEDEQEINKMFRISSANKA